MSTKINAGETHIPATQVRAGDVVLGFLIGTQAMYHGDSYVADPRPDAGDCGCSEHRNLADDGYEGPAVVLYDGELWDYICDVVPADTVIIIRTRPEDVIPKGVTFVQGNPMNFRYKGKRCRIYPTPGQPELFSVRVNGETTLTRRKTHGLAVQDTVAYINGDRGVVTGMDNLAKLLSL